MKYYTKGDVDYCYPEQLSRLSHTFPDEIVLVTVYPDCKLFIGVDKDGSPNGWAKVVDGKTVWVYCSDNVPKFKKRFYDPL